MSISKRIERLENAAGENPTGAAVVIFARHQCGEPTPPGEPEPGPTCEICGEPLTRIVKRVGSEHAPIIYRIPDNGRDPHL